jgi:hypothetical protein
MIIILKPEMPQEMAIISADEMRKLLGIGLLLVVDGGDVTACY